jgi:methionyl-tRNA synthetase
MVEEKKVQEECLYCHGQLKPGNSCPACGDTKLAEPRRQMPPMLKLYPQPPFDPGISGV